MRGEIAALELRRQYHCCAYNALVALISCTQTELKFYVAFLFSENPVKVGTFHYSICMHWQFFFKMISHLFSNFNLVIGILNSRWLKTVSSMVNFFLYYQILIRMIKCNFWPIFKKCLHKARSHIKALKPFLNLKPLKLYLRVF